MIKKTVSNVREACEGIKDGMTFMLGGFGLCGFPKILFQNWFGRT